MTTGVDMRDEDEALAAEYALGLLSPAEGAEAERRIAADPAFRAAVTGWQEHLSGLAEGLPDVAPPARVKKALAARLFARQKTSLWSRVWAPVRFALGAFAGAAAVALAVVLIAPLDRAPTLQAEMAAADRSMVIEARLEEGALAITRIAGEAPAGRVLELWLIDADGVAVSLGVLAEAGESRLTVPEPLLNALAPGLTLAVTDEPPGGAPGGVATGAVLAAGPITQA